MTQELRDEEQSGAISPASPKTLAQLINANVGQAEFLEAIANHDFVLYGGEGSGGKSYILRWWLVDFLIDCYETLGLKGVRVGLFCEDYPALQDRQVIKMQAEFPKWMGRLAHGETWNFTLADKYGGGQIGLRNLDDPSKYVSSEFAAIGVDELTKNPLAVFNDLRWRIRWPGITRRPFGATANPGEPGSLGRAWVKKYWIDRDFPPEFYVGVDERTGKMRPDITKEFRFVKCLASHNQNLDEAYWYRLLSLPPSMAKRVAYGDWDEASGLYFAHFDPKRHVIPHNEAMARIKTWHQRSLSGDWGYDHPHCFHWHAKDERDWVITHDELWDREIGEVEVGKRVTECEAKYHNLQRLNGFAFSWDALGKMSPRSTQKQPQTTWQMMSKTLGPRIPAAHPNDSSPGVRLIRSRLMSQLLESGTWQISDRCEKLIEAIPQMLRDEKNTEQMAKVDWDEAQIGDDPVDSAGMGLQWMVGNSIKPRDVQLEETLSAIRSKFAGQSDGTLVIPGQDTFARFGGRKHA